MKELTQVEVTTLNAYRQVNDNIIRELGIVAVLQKDINTRRDNAESALDENRTGQQDYLKSLQEKYGPGQLDLDRGLFIPANQPQQVQLTPSPVETKTSISTTSETAPKKKTRTTKKKS